AVARGPGRHRGDTSRRGGGVCARRRPVSRAEPAGGGRLPGDGPRSGRGARRCVPGRLGRAHSCGRDPPAHGRWAMKELLSTLPGGLVTGAVYALLAMGLVLIYKATRVPNFAYGAMATAVAFFHYNLVNGHTFHSSLNVLFLHVHLDGTLRLSFWTAIPLSLAVAAAL